MIPCVGCIGLTFLWDGFLKVMFNSSIFTRSSSTFPSPSPTAPPSQSSASLSHKAPPSPKLRFHTVTNIPSVSTVMLRSLRQDFWWRWWLPNWGFLGFWVKCWKFVRFCRIPISFSWRFFRRWKIWNGPTCINGEFSANRPLPSLTYRHTAEWNSCKPSTHLRVYQSSTNTSICLENEGFGNRQGVWPILGIWPEMFWDRSNPPSKRHTGILLLQSWLKNIIIFENPTKSLYIQMKVE